MKHGVPQCRSLLTFSRGLSTLPATPTPCNSDKPTCSPLSLTSDRRRPARRYRLCLLQAEQTNSRRRCVEKHEQQGASSCDDGWNCLRNAAPGAFAAYWASEGIVLSAVLPSLGQRDIVNTFSLGLSCARAPDGGGRDRVTRESTQWNSTTTAAAVDEECTQLLRSRAFTSSEASARRALLEQILVNLLDRVGSPPVACSDAVLGSLVVNLLKATVDDVSADSGGNYEKSRNLRSLLDRISASASAAHLSCIVRALRVGAVTEGSKQRGYDDWHPLVTAPTVKLLLQRILRLIRNQQPQQQAKRAGADGSSSSSGSSLSPDVLASLHSSILSVSLPPADEPRLAAELAKLSMSCLKGAPLFQLCELYTYLTGVFSPVPPAVTNKFLAYSGITLLHSVTQTSVAPSEAQRETVCGAVDSFLRSGRDAEFMEEGLSHGCALLAAMGMAERVRSIYAQVSIRETPYSVAACLQLPDSVGPSVAALHRLAVSRPRGGWVTLPPPVQQAIAEVCRHVGAQGGPGDVAAVYAALVGFHNAGHNIGQCMEGVLAGVCDRMGRLPAFFAQRWPAAVTPREVLAHVLPVVRAALEYIGDDVNCDMLMECIHAALSVRDFAVPLTVGLLSVFRAAKTLSVQELFERADATTQHLPFLQYYALYYARDCGLRDPLEHLCVCWRAASEPIWRRDAQLAAPYKLWRCTSCGRANSDRFNYCLCSAMRNGFLICGACGYAQDEREKLCRCCGATASAKTAAAAYTRKAWSCSACKASNPARQGLLCFRCHRPTSPIAEGSLQCIRRLEGDARRPRSERALLLGLNDDDAAAEGGSRFRREYAARHSLVWQCIGCGRLHSSLERVCNTCPQVEYTPSSVVAAAESPARVCAACGAAEPNPFRLACAQCSAALPPHRREVEPPLPSTTAADGARGGSVTCAACGNSALPTPCPLLCPSCMAPLPLNAREIEAGSIRATLGVLRSWWEEALRTRPAAETLESLASVCTDLQRIVRKATAGEEEDDEKPTRQRAFLDCRGEFIETTSAITASLSSLFSESLASRRASALVRQLLTSLDELCGVEGSQYFKPSERCHECLGSHPPELCAFAQSGWRCEECQTENTNADVCRYVCRSCLTLRPVVQDLFPSECWTCEECGRANVEFDAYCIHCARARPELPTSPVVAADSAVKLSREQLAMANHIPFAPSQCAACGLIFLEAKCPLCTNHVPEWQQAQGVVKSAGRLHPYVEPLHARDRRVPISSAVLRRPDFHTFDGKTVSYIAELKDGGFKITRLFPLS